MAVKLRLRRTGAKNQPRYRIVAADARSPRDGRFIEVIGHYDPTRRPHEAVINAELAQKWLRRGAQPTETVRSLLVEQGILARSAEAVAAGAPAAAGAAMEQAPPAAAEVVQEPAPEPQPQADSGQAEAPDAGERPADADISA